MEDGADLSGVAQARSVRSATTETKAEAAPAPDVAAEMEVDAEMEEKYWECPLSPDPPELRDGLRRLAEAERAMESRRRPRREAGAEIPAGWAWQWDDSLVMVKRYKCNKWEDPAYANLLRDHGSLFARVAAAMNDMERWDDWDLPTPKR
uniref:Uncharacterized protein n=1 Tax=Oryza punctata TaxID=4537 RepID=A0A0E0JF11_ORYPU